MVVLDTQDHGFKPGGLVVDDDADRNVEMAHPGFIVAIRKLLISEMATGKSRTLLSIGMCLNLMTPRSFSSQKT